MRCPWDSRVAWSILERLGRLDRGSNPRYPIKYFFYFRYKRSWLRVYIFEIYFLIFLLVLNPLNFVFIRALILQFFLVKSIISVVFIQNIVVMDFLNKSLLY